MEILYLTEFLSAVGGGGEIAFSALAQELGKRGHSIHIICHKAINEVDAIKWTNVTIHQINPVVNLPHGRFPGVSEQLSYITHLVFEGAKIIEKHNIDIIHGNTLSPAIAASILGLTHAIPVITTFHHVGAVQMGQSGLARGSATSLMQIWRRRIIEKSILMLPVDCIHAVSRTTALDMQKLGYGGMIEVIPNGVELTKYDKFSTRNEYRPYVLFIGRLVEYKNLDVVIRAFAEATKVLHEANLIIVGDGPMRKKWLMQAQELGISSKVRFLGYISETEKLDLISKCSALVLPSTLEGFGLTVIEAFAMRKPVLVSDISALRELVSDGIDGFVISPSNPHEWATKIILLLSDTSLSTNMGTNGRNKISNDFRIEKIGASFEALYNRIISRRNVMDINAGIKPDYPIRTRIRKAKL